MVSGRGDRPIVLEFRTPELLMITVFGLSMVGILAGRVALKGIAAAGLGMMASRSPFFGTAVGEGGLAGLVARGGRVLAWVDLSLTAQG